MREILFRGKRVDNRRWTYGGYYHATLYNRDEIDDHYIMPTCDLYDEDIDVKKVIPETVTQFTGLLDKNGIRIFEGDILSINSCPDLVVVEYPDLAKPNAYETLSWNCVTKKHPHYRHRLENKPSKYEVVGNIHDNPELLEE